MVGVLHSFALLRSICVVGVVGGSVCILVIVFNTFLRSRSVGGGRFFSFSSAVVDVVRKHPVIAFMACRWTVENLLS